MIEVCIHHGGTFQHYPKVRYLGGRVTIVSITREEFFHQFFEQYIVGLGYGSDFRIHFRQAGRTISRGLILWVPELTSTELIDELRASNVVDLYVEHSNEILDWIDVPDNELPITQGSEPCVTQEHNDGDQQSHALVAEGGGREHNEEAKESENEDADRENAVIVDNEVSMADKGKTVVEEIECDSSDSEDYSVDPYASETNSDTSQRVNEQYSKDSDSDYIASSDDTEFDSDDDGPAVAPSFRNCREVYPLTIRRKKTTAGLYIIGGEDSMPTLPANSDVEDSDHLPDIEESESDNSEKAPQFDKRRHMKKPEFALGMEFAGPEEFREMVRACCMLSGFDVKWKKNEGARITVKCLGARCPWRVYGRWNRDKTKWKICTLNNNHDCDRVHFNNKKRSKWLAEWYLERIRRNPRWEIKSLAETIDNELQLILKRNFVWEVRRKALQMIEGSFKEQYWQLWDYAHALKKWNPGCYCTIKSCRQQDGDENKFFGFFVAYEAQIKGFKSGCRPVVGLDGCFMKGAASGVMLSACCRDANNGMFPIAMAAVESECKATWQWFMECFMDAIKEENPERLVFISDRQKVTKF